MKGIMVIMIGEIIMNLIIMNSMHMEIKDMLVMTIGQKAIIGNTIVKIVGKNIKLLIKYSKFFKNIILRYINWRKI